ncbi:MAG: hypothetical protein GIW94_13190 [Candidatus Eremiobacteraeota bacterium]|nr:hypothetical protein [Candidatus Eremiobacteraeota bacterium]
MKVWELVTVCVCVASTFSLNVLELLSDRDELLEALLLVVVVLPDMLMLEEALFFELEALFVAEALAFSVAEASLWLDAFSAEAAALALAALADAELLADLLLLEFLSDELLLLALLSDELLLLAFLSDELLLLELSLADWLALALKSPEELLFLEWSCDSPKLPPPLL